jgi:hypothetical protein
MAREKIFDSARWTSGVMMEKKHNKIALAL